MTTPSLRQRLASPHTRVTAKDELRQRILEIVDRKGSLTDMAIWQESAPDYLPWQPMLEEIKALAKEQKLRLETPRPGHLVIHSLNAQPATEAAAQAGSKPKSRKASKRSGSTAKKTRA